jgi:hypothetical protein
MAKTWPHLVILFALLFTLESHLAAEPAYRTRTIEGWTVHIEESLLSNDVETTENALKLLQQQLAEIVRVVPAEALAKLREVPLWFSPPYDGVQPRAEYHPNVRWLRANGRNPAMVKCVEFTDVKNFEKEMRRMPNFTLHELAHAYHDRVLSFNHPEVIAAYQRAKTAKLYGQVERTLGDGSPNTREKAYAMTNHREYFAETTEAFFSRNDFFPFNRAELEQHDPQMAELLRRLWGVAK